MGDMRGKSLREGSWEGLEGEKGSEKDVILFQLQLL